MKAQAQDIPKGSGRLAGKTAMVVGAGSSEEGWGIGRAIAALIAAEGASVLAVDRSDAALERTCALIAEAGGRAAPCVADATDPAALVAAERTCVETFGGPDILVNNVGAGGGSGVLSLTPEAWRAALELNLSSAFYASRAVLPGMLERGRGALVHIASIAGLRHVGNDTMAYGVAKAGLLHLSRLIAMEHARNGVRSNCIAPGLIDTPEIRRRAKALYGAEHEEEVTALRAGTVPNGRLGTAWDIARAAVFLASDEADYMTGAEMVIDGAAICRSMDNYFAEADRRFGRRPTF